MPELPDIQLYIEHLDARLHGEPLLTVQVRSPFVLRTVEPPPAALVGRRVTGLRRLGKQIAVAFEGDLFLVVHLMIAGRLHWKRPEARVGGKITLASFGFSAGTLALTEASTRRRASLHVVAGEVALSEFDRGGLEVLEADPSSFVATLRRENHTLKRALTDPRLFSGIGNAYSDEILHRARLSPLRLTSQLDDAEASRLQAAAQETLRDWIARLRETCGRVFPEKVTAFRPEMAVHGRYRQPCPQCGAPVQRIVYAQNECNYCASCQTEGRLLADRALSRLLKDDWPRTLEELEERRGTSGRGSSGEV
jgi:formamidopyrimidine-DNA glycosylase